MAIDPDDHTVVRAVVDLAHRLGLTTVAEGVETEECLEQLRAIGCDAAQGFLIARPMPAPDVERWLLDRKSDREPVRTAVAMVVPA